MLIKWNNRYGWNFNLLFKKIIFFELWNMEFINIYKKKKTAVVYQEIYS